MMGAVQPFISGAISKTVNMPEDVTVDDIEQLHIDAWRLGIKPLRSTVTTARSASRSRHEEAGPRRDDAPAGSERSHDRAVAARIAELEVALANEQARKNESVVVGAVRERLPAAPVEDLRLPVADCEGYVTVGEYEDGRPARCSSRSPSRARPWRGSWMPSRSRSAWPPARRALSTYVRKYSNMKFEPAGITDDAELRIASSLVDYIFRRVALEYLPADERAELGVLSTAERTQPTLPGVEESATLSVGVLDDGPARSSKRRSPRRSRPPRPGPSRAARRPYCYSCGNVMQRAGSCYVCGVAARRAGARSVLCRQVSSAFDPRCHPNLGR